jgi:hypothetical protein
VTGRPPTARVRVTHPRTDAVRRITVRPPVREIDEQTELGEVYMASLIRSQRRLAVAVCGLAAILLGGIAVLGALVPWFSHWRIFGIAALWLVLGVLVYPALIGLAAYAVRHAERNERDFTHLVHRR